VRVDDGDWMKWRISVGDIWYWTPFTTTWTHDNLLVSVCNAMGFDDVKTFGIPGVCTGPLGGLTA
jgi:hypothetical protein